MATLTNSHSCLPFLYCIFANYLFLFPSMSTTLTCCARLSLRTLSNSSPENKHFLGMNKVYHMWRKETGVAPLKGCVVVIQMCGRGSWCKILPGWKWCRACRVCLSVILIPSWCVVAWNWSRGGACRNADTYPLPQTLMGGDLALGWIEKTYNDMGMGSLKDH